MRQSMDALGKVKGDGTGLRRLGKNTLDRSTEKSSGPYFCDRAMLRMDNHQAWRLSERLTTHGT